MRTDERIERARLLSERSVFAGDSAALRTADRELDAAEADLALVRGRVVHARFLEERQEDPRELELFEHAAELYRALGDVRGEGEAAFSIGVLHQVVRDDQEAAVPELRRALELASRADDRSTMSYALRHLGIAAHSDGRLPEARELLEESTRLRREIGFTAGVAANLVGLVYIAVAEGRGGDARELVAEASALAESEGATRILEQVGRARDAIAG